MDTAEAIDNERLGAMATLEVLVWYLRARLRPRRSDAGIITMEFLMWSLGAAIVVSVIVAVVYYGWLADAKDIARNPRPTAPAP